MKRIKYVFDDIISLENLREAHVEAKKSRRPNRRHAAIAFEADLENNIQRLHDELAAETWTMHPYRCMTRIERGKVREIYYSSSHEDSVVQHAIIRTLGKKIEKTLIRDTYASIKGRGTHDGVARVRDFLASVPESEPCYVGKYDIRKFYKSIDHDALKRSINGKIKDRRDARLLERIVDSHPEGIPIGNPISPMLANLHLSKLDHAAKERFRLRGYFRYLDDIITIATGPDAKRSLKRFSMFLHEHLSGLGLQIKPNEQIFPIERYGVDFLGYVFSHRRIRLRKKTERRFRRAVRNFKLRPTMRNRMTLSSYWGIIKWLSQSSRFWHSFFDKPITKLEVLS